MRVVRAAAWLMCLVPIEWRPKGQLICEEVNKATQFVVMQMQKEIFSDLIEGEREKGRFRKLAPLKGDDGI